MAVGHEIRDVERTAEVYDRITHEYSTLRDEAYPMIVETEEMDEIEREWSRVPNILEELRRLIRRYFSAATLTPDLQLAPARDNKE